MHLALLLIALYAFSTEESSYQFPLPGLTMRWFGVAWERQNIWSANYRMYSYIVDELPSLIKANFSVDMTRQGIFGHSMGGHGALVAALRNPDRYRSVSAFAPIVAPSHCPWGEKAFGGYLGPDRAAWKAYDATELIADSGWQSEILIDQGRDDDFLKSQLMPERFQNACDAANVRLNLRFQEGYDHSYYFIATFMEDHFAHHAKRLG